MAYKGYIILLFVLSLNDLFGQAAAKKSLIFNPVFGNTSLHADSVYKLQSGDSIQFTSLKFYVSNIELIDHHKSVWKDLSSFHLIDAFGLNTKSISIPADINFTKLKFNLGIDSVTNVSGVMGGDLDPTKGMYWTWQSGYINFKLEGISNICITRHNEFQFHLGGYQYPFNNLQTIFIEIEPQENINIQMDIQKIIGQINLKEQNHIMSPSQEANHVSEFIVKSLSLQK